MTEKSYQECRKVMLQINHLRGLITTAKGEVAKWSKIHDTYIETMQPERAESAKKALGKALDKLKEQRKKFAEMKFPENNLV